MADRRYHRAGLPQPEDRAGGSLSLVRRPSAIGSVSGTPPAPTAPPRMPKNNVAAWNDVALSREEVHGRKRQALVAKAAHEFRRRGYHATSMDDIAAALGVTKGALYRYVKSKDEVLFECFMQSNRLAEGALSRADEITGDGAGRLCRFLEHFVEAYLDSNLAGGAMIEIDALTVKQRKSVVQGRDRVDAALRRMIEDGQKDGSLVDEDPKMMIFTFMGAINWIPSWFRPSGELSTAEIAATVSRILCSGLRRRD